MKIEHFAPDHPQHAMADSVDLEKKMLHSEVVHHQDVQKYARFIIDHLKSLRDKSPQQQVSFIVDALSNGNINDSITEAVESKVLARDLGKEEVKAVVDRIRQALIEELKGKIDEKIYFLIQNLYFNIGRNKSVDLIFDIDNKKYLIGKNKEGVINTKIFENAMKKLVQLRHPNLRRALSYDVRQRFVIYEEMEFQSLSNYLKSETGSAEKIVRSLKTISDCIKGAVYLEESGLVLQDIHPDNLGLKKEDSSGVLFDLEGVIEVGEELYYRMAHEGWAGESLTLDGKEKADACEMVKQFGLCLRYVLGSSAFREVFEKLIGKVFSKEDLSFLTFNSIMDDLEKLAADMTRPALSDPGDSPNRISLKEAQTRLLSIVEAVEEFFKLSTSSI